MAYIPVVVKPTNKIITKKTTSAVVLPKTMHNQISPSRNTIRPNPKPQSIKPILSRDRPVIQAKTLRSQKIIKGPSVRTADTTLASITTIKSLRNTGVGKSLIILGNGPSLNEVDFRRLNHPDIKFLMINKPLDYIWPTDYWLFCDMTIFNRYKSYWDKYQNWIFNTTGIRQLRRGSIQIKNFPGHGFSRNLADGFYIGKSSTYAAMQVAYWLNFDRIFLFGVDMCAINGVSHYYGRNEDVNYEKRIGKFNSEAKWYDNAAEILTAEERAKYYFCSSYNKYPFVDKFNRLDQLTAVDTILDLIGR